MKLRVNVNGKAYDVDVEILDDAGFGAAPANIPAPAAAAPAAPAAPRPVAAPAPAAAPSAPVAGALNSPIPGTVVEVKVSVGQTVAPNEVVIIIDAMKMNTPVASPQGGTVREILVKSGDAVKMGQPLIVFG